jgi:hypothetical protein
MLCFLCIRGPLSCHSRIKGVITLNQAAFQNPPLRHRAAGDRALTRVDCPNGTPICEFCARGRESRLGRAGSADQTHSCGPRHGGLPVLFQTILLTRSSAVTINRLPSYRSCIHSKSAMKRDCFHSSPTNAAQPGSPPDSTRCIHASAVPNRQRAAPRPRHGPP